MHTLSSREFNQETSRAKKEALSGPVYITDRGTPSHVLLSYQDYKNLTAQKQSIGEMLSMDGVEDIEFTPSLMQDKPTAAEF